MKPLSQLVADAYARYANGRNQAGAAALTDVKLFAYTLSQVLREQEEQDAKDLAIFA